MKAEIKSYSIKDFVRKNVSGELDLEKSLKLAKAFAKIASLHTAHNILIDMRDTTISSVKITDLMKVSLEIANNLPGFNNKIVSVIPVNEERRHIAKQFQSCIANSSCKCNSSYLV